MLIYLLYSLPCLCGNKKQGRIGHIRKRGINVLRKAVDRIVVLFNGIPFVYDDYRRFARLVSDAGDLFILLGNAFICINENKAARSTAI